MKKLQEIRVEEVDGERVLVKTYSDGSTERVPVVAIPPKERRPGLVRYHEMNKGRKKRF